MTILTNVELQQIRERNSISIGDRNHEWFSLNECDSQRCPVCIADGMAIDDRSALLSHIAAMEAELTEHRETILYSEGFFIKDGDKAGWWDSCSSSDAVQAGDALVATGLWERHADGVGRRQFYRKVPA